MVKVLHSLSYCSSMVQEMVKVLNASEQDRENISQLLHQYFKERVEDETFFDSESEAKDCTVTGIAELNHDRPLRPVTTSSILIEPGSEPNDCFDSDNTPATPPDK